MVNAKKSLKARAPSKKITKKAINKTSKKAKQPKPLKPLKPSKSALRRQRQAKRKRRCELVPTSGHYVKRPNAPDNQQCFVYILENDACTHSYVGYAVEPRKRIRQHNRELVNGAEKTLRHKPWHFAAIMTADPEWFNPVQAQMLEWAIQKSLLLQKSHAKQSKKSRSTKVSTKASKKVSKKASTIASIVKQKIYGHQPTVKVFNNLLWTFDNLPKFTDRSIDYDSSNPKHKIDIHLQSTFFNHQPLRDEFAKCSFWRPTTFLLDVNSIVFDKTV